MTEQIAKCGNSGGIDFLLGQAKLRPNGFEKSRLVGPEFCAITHNCLNPNIQIGSLRCEIKVDPKAEAQFYLAKCRSEAHEDGQ
jgi:hypothetical protein